MPGTTPPSPAGRRGASKRDFPEPNPTALPSTPLNPVLTLRAYVLRTVRLTDPAWVRYCRRLVGCEVALAPSSPAANGNGNGAGKGHGSGRGGGAHGKGGGSGSGGHGRKLVVAYDEATGAHTLVDPPGRLNPRATRAAEALASDARMAARLGGREVSSVSLFGAERARTGRFPILDPPRPVKGP